MLRGDFKEIVLQALNILLGLGSLVLIGWGYSAGNGLAGLGLALLMTSLICFFGFSIGIEQRIREEQALKVLRSPRTSVSKRMSIAS